VPPSTDLRLERGTPEQVGAIRDLTLRAYAKWVPVTARKPRPMTVDYDLAVQEHRFDCLWDAARLVGLIETVPEGDELLIVNVAVEPDCQGRGLGVRLMRHAEAIAREAGLRGTRLYTNKLMAANIALYEALGYAFEKETSHGPGMVAVHMTRPIDRAEPEPIP
jgi:ribosomal protein S18 acetylase RimI-like enzyme